MAGNQGTDCSNPYRVAGAKAPTPCGAADKSPSPPETLISHRLLTEPLKCTVFKTGGRGDEPRRWVRLPCALASASPASIDGGIEILRAQRGHHRTEKLAGDTASGGDRPRVMCPASWA